MTRGFRCGLVVLLACAPGVAGHGGAPTQASPPDLHIDLAVLPIPVSEVEGVEGSLFRDGPVFVAGQPSQAALERLRGMGVAAVINLRTPQEVENRQQVPFDEAEAVRQLGLEYVHIPLGGKDHPYTPRALEQFAEVVARHQGRLLLHCGVGWRAAYLWTAYLVRFHGVPLEAAMARVEAVAIPPSPLGQLLGRRVKLVFAE